MMNPIFESQYSLFRDSYSDSILKPIDGTYIIQIPNVNLHEGWNMKQTTIWFHVPHGYPVAKPDCFWTDRNLRLANGMMPMNTGFNPMPDQSNELWFSWHAEKWNPNKDNLLTYMHMIEARLREIR